MHLSRVPKRSFSQCLDSNACAGKAILTFKIDNSHCFGIENSVTYLRVLGDMRIKASNVICLKATIFPGTAKRCGKIRNGTEVLGEFTRRQFLGDLIKTTSGRQIHQPGMKIDVSVSALVSAQWVTTNSTVDIRR